MGIKPGIRFSDESFIEPLLAAAGFVACHKEDGLTLHVEGESDAPLTIRCTEAHPLHIRVTGIVQGIGARTPSIAARIAAGAGRGQGSRSARPRAVP